MWLFYSSRPRCITLMSYLEYISASSSSEALHAFGQVSLTPNIVSYQSRILHLVFLKHFIAFRLPFLCSPYLRLMGEHQRVEKELHFTQSDTASVGGCNWTRLC
ncbi:hypothetical protein BGZ57DRAFT_465880 [Hyaloscypha finlandica]|nr:hypothetical protein BGZ57DRAFT_465880 [Hyaloscypha finlandica]